MAPILLSCFLLTWVHICSAAKLLDNPGERKEVRMYGVACSDIAHGKLENSPGVVDSYIMCAKLCKTSSECISLTFNTKSKKCTHYSKICTDMQATADVVTMTLDTAFRWFLVAHGKKCDGAPLLSSGKQSSFKECVAVCEFDSKCASITYLADTKDCSLFTTACEKNKKAQVQANAISFDKFPSNTACDFTVPDKDREVYIENGSGKQPDYAACKQACLDHAECMSITFYLESRFCSLVSTPCKYRKCVPLP